MGMQSSIAFTSPMPDWGEVNRRLVEQGLTLTIRMIDGLPAFPDEIPDASWQELRISTANGMLTLRRTGDGITCIVWGNAEPGLLRDQDQIVATLASLTNGESTSRPAH